MDGKTDPKLWAMVTVLVAVIGCLGLIGASFIQVLPNLLKPSDATTISTPTISSSVPELQPVTPTLTDFPKVVTQAPSSPSSGQSLVPVVTNCPSPSSYAIDGKTLKPDMSISGPATIHPFDGSAELAKVVGLDWIPRWGINIPTGVTIQIPQTVTLLSGQLYAPDGYVDIYTDDARMEAAQKCWLINNP